MSPAESRVFWSYLGVGAVLFVGAVLLQQSNWRGNSQLHTLMELTACLTALFVGVLAMVRYYTRKSNTYLFVGVGFFGTFLLDGYHMVVTSELMDYLMPSPPENLIPWSWNASRTFLSILLALSWWTWHREQTLGEAERLGEKGVYAMAIGLTVAVFCFFAFYPLPRAYYPELFFGRPEEFVAAAFFLVALIGYLNKGAWQHDPFEHWLVLSLMIGLIGQAVAMSRSFVLFDAMFDLAHLLKIVTYVCVMIGLLANGFELYTQAEQSAIERKRHLEEVQEQENRTLAILNSTADGMITVSAAGSILSINRAALMLFGYADEELLDTEAARLVPVLGELRSAPDRTPLPAGEFRAFGAESEVSGHRKDGAEIPVALRITETEYGGKRLFIATVQDITERKQAEDERNRLFGGIREAVGQLASSSSEILAGTTQQAASAQQQAATVSETAATVDEITQSANQSTDRAKEVAESARKADKVAKSGRKAVDETIAAMRTVRGQVESTAENILALAERAQAIGAIITTVNDIADQTNLLALNAAIEASRAGEHGKGFAVVASEIKALAEQSKKATDQVRQILGEIQQATNTAVVSTEQGTKSVNDATAVVSKAEETIDVLGNTIGEAARAAAQIVAAAGQQAAGMNQISQSMSHINEATQQSLASTRQAEDSARSLNDLGNRLTELIEGNGRPVSAASITGNPIPPG